MSVPNGKGGSSKYSKHEYTVLIHQVKNTSPIYPPCIFFLLPTLPTTLISLIPVPTIYFFRCPLHPLHLYPYIPVLHILLSIFFIAHFTHYTFTLHTRPIYPSYLFFPLPTPSTTHKPIHTSPIYPPYMFFQLATIPTTQYPYIPVQVT